MSVSKVGNVKVLYLWLTVTRADWLKADWVFKKS